VIYAALGNSDQAMSWLEKSYEERFNSGVLAPANSRSSALRRSVSRSYAARRPQPVGIPDWTTLAVNNNFALHTFVTEATGMTALKRVSAWCLG
jgi:hypothetical protein